MPFITQGKTNWKFLLIVVILFTVAGGGIFWFLAKHVPSYQPLKLVDNKTGAMDRSNNYPNIVVPSTITCTDSDGGDQIYKKGTIAIINSKGDQWTYTDYCQNSTNVQEYSCLPDYSNSTEESAAAAYLLVNHQCLYGCQGGACVGTKIIYPSGGEQWEIGKNYRITWNSNGISYPVLIQAITQDYGEEKPDCQNSFSQNNIDPYLGEYDLNIPNDACIGSYKIQICKFDEVNYEASICYESDNYFNIVTPKNNTVYIYPEKDLSTCNNTQDQTEKDICYWVVGQAEQNLLICDKIQKQNLKDSCYSNVGVQKKDLSACDGVQEEGTRAYCYSTIAYEEQNLLICDKIQDQNIKDHCYSGIAYEEKNLSICNQIQNQANKDYCYGFVTLAAPPSICDNLQIQNDKDTCYLYVAQAKQDPLICDKIQNKDLQGTCHQKIK